MDKIIPKRSFSKRAIRNRNLLVGAIFFCSMGFLISHTIWGKKGILHYVQTKKEIQSNIYIIEKIRLEKIKIFNKVKLLNANALDKDFLDEQARKMLDLAEDNEVILMTK